MFKIRAFRAIDDPLGCERFLEGHRKVLTSIGITEVTSVNEDWMKSNASFVIIVETEDETGSHVMGGARIHAADNVHPLPIEEATGYLDKNIYSLIKSKTSKGTGEICGLWNSRQVAGMGIGSMFLTRAAVIIAPQIGLKSLFALCAPYTVKMAESVGYKIVHEIGNNGTFYYPKLDLLATVMFLENTETLDSADPAERDKIFMLRNNPSQMAVESLKGNAEALIQFNLILKNTNINEFHLTNI